jgi:hypothetical protein
VDRARTVLLKAADAVEGVVLPEPFGPISRRWTAPTPQRSPRQRREVAEVHVHIGYSARPLASPADRFRFDDHRHVPVNGLAWAQRASHSPATPSGANRKTTINATR